MNLKKQLLPLFFLTAFLVPAIAQSTPITPGQTITVGLEETSADILQWVEEAQKINPGYLPGIWQNGAEEYWKKPHFNPKPLLPGIKPGHWMWSISYTVIGDYPKGYVGYAKASKGDLGIGTGISALYFSSRSFALGFGIDIVETEKITDGSFNQTEGKLDYQMLKLMARINLNPDNSVRVYIPFGIGYGHFKQTYRGTIKSYYDYWNYDIDKDANKLAHFVGLGLEFNVTPSLSLGLEGQYTAFKAWGEDFAFANAMLKLNIML